MYFLSKFELLLYFTSNHLFTFTLSIYFQVQSPVTICLLNVIQLQSIYFYINLIILLIISPNLWIFDGLSHFLLLFNLYFDYFHHWTLPKTGNLINKMLRYDYIFHFFRLNYWVLFFLVWSRHKWHCRPYLIDKNIIFLLKLILCLKQDIDSVNK